MQTKILDAHHWPDKDVFIVPDVYAKYCAGSYPEPGRNLKDAKKFYLDLFNKANSNQSGCCQYVEDSYYKYPRECFPNAFMIDSNTIENDQEILI